MMFKHKLFALGLIAILGGCTAEMTLAEKVKAVQDKAVQLCSYLPTATSVGAIISAGNPAVVGVSAVANAICTAVINWKSTQATQNSFATGCPKVENICVEGEFVQPKKGN